MRMERDIWILLHSVAPAQAADWVADKLDALHDPEFGALYLEHDAAFDLSPADPRLPDLARRTVRWLAGGPEQRAGPYDPRPGYGAAPAGDRVGRQHLARVGSARRSGA
ncbi:hypothetical protein [Nocardia sp. NPDC002869]|uniref:hypothetical protein n=1 Tax=Nocardia sp. NPDC002869 TaxID=3161032 RepID=UPI00398D25F4